MKTLILFLSLSLWGAGAAVGLKLFGDYANSQGQVGRSSLSWPRDSQIAFLDNHLPTLMIFLHPKCPCSRASVDELDVLMARTNGKANVYAVFIQPAGGRWRR